MNAPTASLPSAPALELQHVHLQRGRTQVFKGLSLQLHEPRIGLIGDNGAGKTSLLRLLCGLEVPDQGQVLSQGQNLHAAGSQRARWVGMMFQNPDDQIIFPTVVEELALGLQPQPKPCNFCTHVACKTGPNALSPASAKASASMCAGWRCCWRARAACCWMSPMPALIYPAKPSWRTTLRKPRSR